MCLILFLASHALEKSAHAALSVLGPSLVGVPFSLDNFRCFGLPARAGLLNDSKDQSQQGKEC